MRLEVGSTHYIYHVDTDREWLANKESWEEVEQLIQEQILDPSMQGNVKEEPAKGSLVSSSIITVDDDQETKAIDIVIKTP